MIIYNNGSIEISDTFKLLYLVQKMRKYPSDVSVSKNCIDANLGMIYRRDPNKQSFHVSRRRNGARGQYPKLPLSKYVRQGSATEDLPTTSWGRDTILWQPHNIKKTIIAFKLLWLITLASITTFVVYQKYSAQIHIQNNIA